MEKAQRLANRSARLVRLLEIGAPRIIIENEHRLITEAHAMVMGKPRWRLLMRRYREWRFDREERRSGSDSPVLMSDSQYHYEDDIGHY